MVLRNTRPILASDFHIQLFLIAEEPCVSALVVPPHFLLYSGFTVLQGFVLWRREKVLDAFLGKCLFRNNMGKLKPLIKSTPTILAHYWEMPQWKVLKLRVKLWLLSRVLVYCSNTVWRHTSPMLLWSCISQTAHLPHFMPFSRDSHSHL